MMKNLCAVVVAAVLLAANAAAAGRSTSHAALILSTQEVGASPLRRKDEIATLTRGGAAGSKVDKIKPPPGQSSVGKLLEAHKALWLPVSLALNYHYKNWSTRSSLMSGMFGAYGINWVLKSHLFWDKGYYNDADMVGGFPLLMTVFTMLSIFFTYPLLAAKNQQPIGSVEIIAACLLFSIGSFLHYGADAQKFYTLKYNPGLIKEGFFKKMRSPSYVGEDLIFAAFTIVAGFESRWVWLPVGYLMLGLSVGGSKKRESLSRHKDYEEWKKNTWF